MSAGTTQHNGLGQVFCAIELGFNIFIALVIGGHVFVDCLCLVELALALKVHRQAIQIAHNRFVHWHTAESIKCHVQLTLALQGETHHTVGLRGFFICLYLPCFGHQEALGCQR